MKLGITGVGAIGSHGHGGCATHWARELVPIDKDRERARAIATDMHYGVPH
jgi:L-lactate dehydrogenase